MASTGVWFHTRYMRTGSPETPSSETLIDLQIGRTRNSSKLNSVNDFVGTYSAASSGAALVGGGGIGYLENPQGVIMKVTSSTKGARLNLGVGGVEVAMK